MTLIQSFEAIDPADLSGSSSNAVRRRRLGAKTGKDL
jgi:hypothetical protein